MQNLGVISVNIWQIIISIANLLILFFILKKFLFKPVKKFVANREELVNQKQNEAEELIKEANTLKDEWNQKIDSAKQEATEIINTATKKAAKRSDEIIDEAKTEASNIISNAKSLAELEHKKAEKEIKEEIVVISSELTEKLLEREINENDNKKLINSFLEQVGADNE